MGLRQNMGIQPHKISTRLEPISWGGVPPPKWGMTMGGGTSVCWAMEQQKKTLKIVEDEHGA